MIYQLKTYEVKAKNHPLNALNYDFFKDLINCKFYQDGAPGGT